MDQPPASPAGDRLSLPDARIHQPTVTYRWGLAERCVGAGLALLVLVALSTLLTGG